MKPIIGITLGANDEGDFFLRKQYCKAVAAAGGVPIILPAACRVSEAVTAALHICGGILLSGGGDISPLLCGITEYDPALLFEPAPVRDEFELALARTAYERDIPLLGICRGIQVMNTALGGSLRFHIEGHRQKLSRDQPSHGVTLICGSRLRRLFGEGEAFVNSFHHQALSRAAEGLTVTATSEDGIAEALEAKDRRFFVGVQWHPEHMDCRFSDILFADFVCAAAKGQ